MGEKCLGLGRKWLKTQKLDNRRIPCFTCKTASISEISGRRCADKVVSRTDRLQTTSPVSMLSGYLTDMSESTWLMANRVVLPMDGSTALRSDLMTCAISSANIEFLLTFIPLLKSSKLELTQFWKQKTMQTFSGRLTVSCGLGY